MQSALKLLMDGVIDYAGLFAPARLPMRESLSTYLRYAEGPESWIVGRFICPASRLMELESELSHLGSTFEVPVSVVGTGGFDIESFESALEADIVHMNSFQESVGERASVEAFETRVPVNGELTQVIADLQGFDGVECYLEVPLNDGMDEVLGLIAETEWMSAKARCGGAEANAFPSSEHLAGFLRECSHLDLSYKLTAGLHHPYFHHDPNLNVYAHGFLNVLCGAALMEAHDLSREELQEILEEQRAFSFGEGIQWRELGATEADLQSARDLFVSFGSCSIDEPLEGLAKL